MNDRAYSTAAFDQMTPEAVLLSPESEALAAAVEMAAEEDQLAAAEVLATTTEHIQEAVAGVPLATEDVLPAIEEVLESADVHYAPSQRIHSVAVMHCLRACMDCYCTGRIDLPWVDARGKYAAAVPARPAAGAKSAAGARPADEVIF